MSKSFVVGTYNLRFDDSYMEYSELRAILQQGLNEEAEKLEKHITELGCSDLERVRNLALKGIENIFSSFAPYYMKKGKYDFSVKKLSDGMFISVTSPIYNVYKKARGNIADINSAQEQEEMRRAYRKASRTRVIGGGFGISGFLKGAATAAMINATTGVAHSAFNAVGNAMTSSSASNQRSSVYSAYGNQIIVAFQEGAETLLERIAIDLGIWVKIEGEKASLILSNIDEGIIPKEKIQESLATALLADPYNVGIYLKYLERYNSNRLENELVELAKWFKIDLRYVTKSLRLFDGHQFAEVMSAKQAKQLVEFVVDNIVRYDDNYKEDQLIKLYCNRSALVEEGNEELVELFVEAVKGLAKENESKLTLDTKRYIEEKITGFTVAKTMIKQIEAENKAREELFDRFTVAERAAILCNVFESKCSERLYFGNNIPDEHIKTAYKNYGSQLQIDYQNIVMLVDDAWNNPFSAGIILTSSGEIASSRGNKILLDDLAGIIDGGNRSIIFDSKSNGRINFFDINLSNEENGIFWEFMKGIFNPLVIEKENWNKVKNLCSDNNFDEWLSTIRTKIQNTKRVEDAKRKAEEYQKEVVRKAEEAKKRAEEERKKAKAQYIESLACDVSDCLTDKQYEQRIVDIAKAVCPKVLGLEIRGSITQEIIRNALKSYGSKFNISSKDILLIYDEALFTPGSKGFLITKNGIASSRDLYFDFKSYRIQGSYDSTGISAVHRVRSDEHTWVYSLNHTKEEIACFFEKIEQLRENRNKELEKPEHLEHKRKLEEEENAQKEKEKAALKEREAQRRKEEEERRNKEISRRKEFLNGLKEYDLQRGLVKVFQSKESVLIGNDIGESRATMAYNFYISKHGKLENPIWLMYEPSSLKSGKNGFCATYDSFYNDKGEKVLIKDIKTAFIGKTRKGKNISSIINFKMKEGQDIRFYETEENLDYIRTLLDAFFHPLNMAPSYFQQLDDWYNSKEYNDVTINYIPSSFGEHMNDAKDILKTKGNEVLNETKDKVKSKGSDLFSKAIGFFKRF